MSSLDNHPAQQFSEKDVEKQGRLEPTVIGSATRTESDTFPDGILPPSPALLRGKLARWNAKVEGLAGLEARGIKRVLPEEKHEISRSSYLQMFLLWFSINLVAINIITGLLGPLVFKLGWVDCVCIVIFSNALASAGAAYMSTFGLESGNRTMILGRYFMGYWPSKLACVLNLVMQIGWGIIACITAGQMLSAINGGGLTIAVGCVISALCIGLIATFGIAFVHGFERYAYIAQIFAFLVLIGSAGKNFDTSAVSTGSASTITANRYTFFAFEYAGAVGFCAISADFYVYYPARTSKRLTFLVTGAGLWLALVVCGIIGVGIATGVEKTPGWKDAYEISSGALLLACYDGLGGLGGFCVFLLALGSIANNVPATYSSSLTFQVLGRYPKAIPRWGWCVIVTLTQLVCSVAGRNYLFNVFENFLPIMSYWVCPWLTIALEEHLLFHVLRDVPFDWTAWEDKKRLPVGAAALIAWLLGWAGAITGMSQVWYHGPIALMIGGNGGDVGAWLSIAFAGLTYPPLRYLELKKFGR